MYVADYKTDTVRWAKREEVQAHWQGAERRLARDRGWAPPKDDDTLQPFTTPQTLARWPQD